MEPTTIQVTEVNGPMAFFKEGFIVTDTDSTTIHVAGHLLMLHAPMELVPAVEVAQKFADLLSDVL